MQKHTQGPWVTSAVNRNEVLACGTGAARVAKCLDEFDDNPGGPKYGSGEVEANASLIAAAPDLLDALTDLVGGCGKEGDLFSSAAMDKARYAIEKANAAVSGGTPSAQVAGSACDHNEMIANDEPGYAWKCAKCGYVYGKPNRGICLKTEAYQRGDDCMRVVKHD